MFTTVRLLAFAFCVPGIPWQRGGPWFPCRTSAPCIDARWSSTSVRLSPTGAKIGTLSHDAGPVFCILTAFPTNLVRRRDPVGTNPRRRSDSERLITFSANQIRTPSVAFPCGTRGLSTRVIAPINAHPAGMNTSHKSTPRPSDCRSALDFRLEPIAFSTSSASSRLRIRHRPARDLFRSTVVPRTTSYGFRHHPQPRDPAFPSAVRPANLIPRFRPYVPYEFSRTFACVSPVWNRMLG